MWWLTFQSAGTLRKILLCNVTVWVTSTTRRTMKACAPIRCEPRHSSAQSFQARRFSLKNWAESGLGQHFVAQSSLDPLRNRLAREANLGVQQRRFAVSDVAVG